MKFHPIPLITIGLLMSFCARAQDNSQYRLHLQNEAFIPAKNITTESIADLDKRTAKFHGRSFVIIQFESIPTISERQQLQQAGIELLDYIPSNAYTAIVKGTPDVNALLRTKARALFEPQPVQKMQPVLAKGIFPAHAVKVPGTIDVWVSFPKIFTANEVTSELQQKNIDIVNTQYKTYRILCLRLSQQRIAELAGLPFIEYVQPAPNEDQYLNLKSMASTRANVIKAIHGRRRFTLA